MEVLSETSSSKAGSYRLFPSCSRQSPEMKQSGLGSQCAGLFSTTVLGGSSSAPNLQDYARTHRKKFSSGSLSYKDELLAMPAVKRFSVSFAKHPTNGTQDDTTATAVFPSLWGAVTGFEGCSMVPSIYPLETLHNSLSLKQVNEFLSAMCENAGDAHSRSTRALTAMFDNHNQPSVDSYMPQRVLASSLRSRSDRPPWYSSGPSSTVSSAGPSSPITADTSPRFSFSDKISLTPQSSEETHSCQHSSTQPTPTAASQAPDPTCPDLCTPTSPTEDHLTPSNPPEDNDEDPATTGHQLFSERPDHRQEEPGETSAAVEASGDETPEPSPRPPCSPLVELSLGRMEGYCGLPGSLPVLLELRESSSEAGSSSQTPQSPEGPDVFFDTQESLELWRDTPGSLPLSGTPLEVGATRTAEP
ncbi:inositol hexakisphosphate and diphosphoinositol-pentakisphosphate kinase 1-like isoform 3-T3 [Polymixia lowei]